MRDCGCVAERSIISPDSRDAIMLHSRYTIRLKQQRVMVESGKGRFASSASKPGFKIYVVSNDSGILYVGHTKQRIRQRLNGGLHRPKRSGYHGYKWRSNRGPLTLDVWTSFPHSTTKRQLETVEAEVVYLVRRLDDQWPENQTEIHFHRSTGKLRRIAEKIYRTAGR